MRNLLRAPIRLCGVLLIWIAAAMPMLAQGKTQVAAIAASPEAAPVLTTHYPRYVIQTQDVLSISFPITPELDQTLTVEPDGYISPQNAAALHVQGLTLPEVTAALNQAYIGILHDPIIHVAVKDFQKPFFSVLGQVVKPGQYELRTELTVSEAIAIAGGFSPTAKSRIFVFRRSSSGWNEVNRINLADVTKGRRPQEDSLIRPGDMIYVPDSAFGVFKKYVPYSVNAGTYLTPNPF